MDVLPLQYFAQQVLQEAVLDLKVLTDRSSRLVVHVQTHAGVWVVKADAQAGTFAPEIEALKRLEQHGFPVQRPVAWQDGPPALLLLPWTQGTEPEVGPAAQSIGALLAHLHQLPGHLPPPEGLTWAQWMRGWLQHALTYWLATGLAPAGAPTRLSRWFSRLESLLEKRGTQLILFDGRPEHFIVAPSGDVGLIDVAELRAGDGLMDLAVIGINGPGLLPGVLRGYGPLTPGEQALLKFYSLLRALAAAEWNERELGGADWQRFLEAAALLLPGEGCVGQQQDQEHAAFTAW
ncbi:aminoglycoside phosphotransferase family protein [Deinococcus hopiensis]|uniref:Putative homoserine kinase type II (Protein kinase fold) n=1 Tax=Deinococcus hopiensis KR-140 TaxID=695939 RepID=A0A1W1UKU1_9DEIO|nr:aminoglycoside phosphotransferase family protein [Deinococcus hopiensis]SMB81364.1 Putative homoserine kinase type II (protein kinase fold) [Deinococcus hopiensis KR-140]